MPAKARFSAPLAIDPEGNLYGGANGGVNNYGVIFKVSPTGNETVLHAFTDGADGANPSGGVVMGPHGYLYGTTTDGGAGSLTGVQEGVIFKMTLAGEETVLYSFTGLSDGGQPVGSAPIVDQDGNLYGTTADGGYGAGVVYKLTASGQEIPLYSFLGGDGGGTPFAGVVRDKAGNLYGTAVNGGPNGGGILYEITAAGEYILLHSFTGGPDGGDPQVGVTLDSVGNAYGATIFGGDLACSATAFSRWRLRCGVRVHGIGRVHYAADLYRRSRGYRQRRFETHRHWNHSGPRWLREFVRRDAICAGPLKAKPALLWTGARQGDLNRDLG